MMCHLFYEFSCVSQQHRDVRFYFLIFFNNARLLFFFLYLCGIKTLKMAVKGVMCACRAYFKT